MKEALLYSRGKDKSVVCFLCGHNCHIKNGARGICAVRENKDGALYSVFYGRPCALAVDPIEKKPLFHFMPGTRSFSVATLGCNFQCDFCQNWDISQFGKVRGTDDIDLQGLKEFAPEEIVAEAQGNNCRSISYTYSEPTIFYEYAKDIAKIAVPKGIKNVFVTNGYMSRKMLDDFHPLLAAANVDLKSFNKETYRRVMRADIAGVLDSIAHMKELGIWIEITTLIVPDMNDSDSELHDIADFIAGVGKEIPWHISRFHPQYKMTDRAPTPLSTLKRAYDIGKSGGLKYVYLGNVPGDDKESTYCWNCGETLIERAGFAVLKNKLSPGAKCPKCNSIIDGVF